MTREILLLSFFENARHERDRDTYYARRDEITFDANDSPLSSFAIAMNPFIARNTRVNDLRGAGERGETKKRERYNREKVKNRSTRASARAPNPPRPGVRRPAFQSRSIDHRWYIEMRPRARPNVLSRNYIIAGNNTNCTFIRLNSCDVASRRNRPIILITLL